MSSSLYEQITQLVRREPSTNERYYSVTLLGAKDGDAIWSCYSHWIGFEDEECRIELRAASLVDGSRIATFRRNAKQGCAVVDSLDDMLIFYLIGGHAVIRKEIAEAAIPEVLAPAPCVQSGEMGFRGVKSLPKGAFNRAPTQKLRMNVLKRDDFRCRVCGRRATDHVDIELHVHHIRPWALRGITEVENLITLCHTCHNGLDPHFEPNLFELLRPAEPDAKAKEHWDAVSLYRRKVVLEFSRGSSDDAESYI